MAIQKVTILEFAPTADEIWRIARHPKDGYIDYDTEKGLLSLPGTARDAKQRPEIITTYAGGKATNVARVMDRLLVDEDEICVEQVTFLPPPPEGPLQELDLGSVGDISLRPSTAAGIYIQCLQIAGLNRVKPRFEVVDELAETGGMQTTRSCIEITLREGGGTVNFSPRIVWSQRAAEAVRLRVAEVAREADLVVMAGSPPIWEAEPGARLTLDRFYAEIMALTPHCQVSIDTRGKYLRGCLITGKMPDFAFMNTEEFSDLTELLKEGYKTPRLGYLVVHDETGCWVWEREFPDEENPFPEADYFPSIPVDSVYSTIGAGDAMHAGFLKEWICSGSLAVEERLRRSVLYSQVVAAAAVSNEKATHGVDAHVVQRRFQEALG